MLQTREGLCPHEDDGSLVIWDNSDGRQKRSGRVEGRVGTRKHQKIRIGVLKCLTRIFPGDLSIVQGFCEV